jgi:hypothetical protein
MVIYYSENQYIQSQTDLLGKITAIDNVINALNTSLLNAATNQNIQEYSLNDGQTQIRTVYRTMDSIINGITALERVKQRYLAQLNGNRVVRGVDSSNFNVVNRR